MKLRLEVGGGEEQKRKMIADLDAMAEMIGSILSFARDDAKREPRTLIDLDSWSRKSARTLWKPARRSRTTVYAAQRPGPADGAQTSGLESGR